jgi:hypothetical protein
MPEVKGHTDPLNSFCHTNEFLGKPAEEFFDTNHIFEAGKNRVLLCTFPDLPERFFLEIPDFLGQKFAYRRQVTRMDDNLVS